MTARLERKKNEPEGLATMIEPEGDAFWEVPNAHIDTRQRPLAKKEIEEIWADRKRDVAETQRCYVRRLVAQEKRDEKAKQREEDRRIAESNKRNADQIIDPATEKARKDREARIKKTMNDAQEIWRRRNEVSIELVAI